MRRDVFQAIADPTRRDIIVLLSDKALNLNTIAENFDISRPAISKHIKILRECGIISIQQKGRERYCKIRPESLNEVAAWIEQFRSLWEAKLDSFEQYLEALKESKSTENNKGQST